MYSVPLRLLARMYTHGDSMFLLSETFSDCACCKDWVPAFAGMTSTSNF